jgi:CheY-like chemotaxis protein
MLNSQITILVVDDDAALRHSVSLVLGSEGYCVRCAEDGVSALEQIREATPDILLSDLQMPGMSGFELLSLVRHRFPEIFVIAFSGAYSGDEVPSGVAADAFYAKASGLGLLFGAVERGVDFKQPSLRSVRKLTPLWVSRGAGGV